ncbi:MAG: glycosyltransferase family 4 protein [Acidobacteria bacterium]|nr:glycosyltransferase family 4 protein [Acidobacteriota bacterium]
MNQKAHPSSKKKVRVAYLVTHPIQYQAPLLRLIAQDPSIDLTVFFCSRCSVNTYQDPEFGRAIKWDVPLLEGYKHEFLPALWGRDEAPSFFRPFNYGLWRKLRKGKFDFLWVHGYGRAYNLFAIAIAKCMRLPVLVRDESTETSTKRGALKERLSRLFFCVLRNQVDKCLAIGSSNREYYLQRGVRPEKIVLMPYAVNNDFFRDRASQAERNRDALRRQLELDASRPVILYASKFTERKRARDLLEAYTFLSPDGKAEPAPYLLLIGEGTMLDSLKSRVAERGWDSVRFLGFKNQTELPSYYDLCDVFVLPSFNEPWGLVINEVMNASKAVIVSDQVGCAKDLVKEGQNGCIFQAGNVLDLHRALCRVLADRQRCRQMGRKSLEIISKWSFEEDLRGIRAALGLQD